MCYYVRDPSIILMSLNYSPDIAILTGFAETPGIDEFQQALDKKIHPKSCTVIQTVPLQKASRHPELIVNDVGETLDNLQARILIAHSYATIVILMAACRREFKGISKLFLIDGPLRSHVAVDPIKGLFSHFQIHYDYRETLAKAWEESLRESDLSKIIAIGSDPDILVPAEAKFIDGLPYVRLANDRDVTSETFDAAKGYNVVLPKNYKGHSLQSRVGIVSDIIQHSLGIPPGIANKELSADSVTTASLT